MTEHSRLALATAGAPANVAQIHPSAARLPRELSDAELELFGRGGSRMQLASGEVVFSRGELGRSMFIIESGQVSLDFGDSLPNKLIGPREFFGELALFIGNHTRVANAIASTSCVVLVIEHRAFEHLLQIEPQLLAHFMRRSFCYLVASEERLIQSLKRRNEDLQVTLDSLRQTQTQLSTAQRLVQTDEMTGLCNRRGLYTFLGHLDQQRLPGTALGLLLVDVDRFKQINDHCGHLLGDQVLSAIAEEVHNAASSCDLPCRLGGDEFALLAQVTGAEELAARAAQIVSAVRALRFTCGERSLAISVSVGASLCATASDWAVWYSDADRALYQAKGEGGDNWSVLG